MGVYETPDSAPTIPCEWWGEIDWEMVRGSKARDSRPRGKPLLEVLPEGARDLVELIGAEKVIAALDTDDSHNYGPSD